MAFTIKATMRTESGKSASKRQRASGLVPMNLVIPEKNESVQLLTQFKDFRKVYNQQEHFLVLEIENSGIRHAHVKEIHWDYLKDEILQVDLIEVSLDRPITAAVTLVFRGTPVGAGKGGVFNRHTDSLDVMGLPGDIPSKIEVDVSNLDIDDHITVKDIVMPKNVSLVTREDLWVCEVHIAARAKVVEATDEEVAAEEAAAAAAAAEASAAPAARPKKA